MKFDEFIKRSQSVQVVLNAADMKEIFLQMVDEKMSSSYTDAVNEDSFLSPDEVAKMFKVSKVTLWRWATKDILTPIKIGKKVYYRMTDLEKLIKK